MECEKLEIPHDLVTTLVRLSRCRTARRDHNQDTMREDSERLGLAFEAVFEELRRQRSEILPDTEGQDKMWQVMPDFIMCGSHLVRCDMDKRRRP